MDGDEEFFEMLEAWAEGQNKKFVIENFDGREMEDTIDGVRAADVWGWLVPKDAPEDQDTLWDKYDDDFGCVEWAIVDGKIKLTFVQYEEVDMSSIDLRKYGGAPEGVE